MVEWETDQVLLKGLHHIKLIITTATQVAPVKTVARRRAFLIPLLSFSPKAKYMARNDPFADQTPE